LGRREAPSKHRRSLVNVGTAQPRAGSGIAAVIRRAAGLGTLRIRSAATMHSAPAAKNAGK